MRSPQRLLLFLFTMAVPSIVVAAGLPDTGQTLCDNGSNVMEACSQVNTGDASTMPGQDARYGRDPAAAAGQVIKVGAGDAGFDYSKIANDGSTLAASATLGSNATDWACTQDNITGLMWEVKTASGPEPRGKDYTYGWYSDGTRGDGTANELNAGHAGESNGGNCNNKYDPGSNPTGDYCDTAGYVATINGVSLCSYNDWRLPSIRELNTIVHLGNSNLAFDATYFPNTKVSNYWSASSDVSNPRFAWSIQFAYGYANPHDKLSYAYVRLVRGGQF